MGTTIGNVRRIGAVWMPLVLSLVCGVDARAQDEGEIDLLSGDDEVEEESIDRFDGADDLDALPEPDSMEEEEPLPTEPDVESMDLLGEESTVDFPEDSPDLYRRYLGETEGLPPDEAVPLWEEYLTRYPETPFRSRIQDRIDALMSELYAERSIDTEESVVDADDRELWFAQALLLENINPRNRIQAGFEWGLPDYMNLYASYEYAFERRFSVHGGVRRRYTGWNIETGVRYALVKSQRTKTLVTLIGDLHVNTNPAFFGIRPQVAVGQIFADVIHVQVQGGVDLEARRNFGLRVIGGANVTWMASDGVAVFGETSINMKNLTWPEGGVFRFNTASVGFKFFPKIKGQEPHTMEINVGGSVPYTSNYWMYHYGSIMGQVTYYY